MWFSSVQFSSVAQSCPTLCDLINCSTPGLPVQHQLLEFTQTHVHRVSDAIQPSHPLSSPSPPAPNPSQHQSLFQWVNSSPPLKQNVSLVGSKAVCIWGLPCLPHLWAWFSLQGSWSPRPAWRCSQSGRARVHTAPRIVCVFRLIASLEAYFQPQQMPLCPSNCVSSSMLLLLV